MKVFIYENDDYTPDHSVVEVFAVPDDFNYEADYQAFCRRLQETGGVYRVRFTQAGYPYQQDQHRVESMYEMSLRSRFKTVDFTGTHTPCCQPAGRRSPPTSTLCDATS